MIKFNKFNVSNGSIKARVWYSLDNRTDGRSCVTMYAKDYDSQLHKIFPADFKNNSDSMTDYFEKTKVVLFSDHPLYQVARQRVEQIESERKAKRGLAA